MIVVEIFPEYFCLEIVVYNAFGTIFSHFKRSTLVISIGNIVNILCNNITIENFQVQNKINQIFFYKPVFCSMQNFIISLKCRNEYMVFFFFFFKCRIMLHWKTKKRIHHCSVDKTICKKIVWHGKWHLRCLIILKLIRNNRTDFDVPLKYTRQHKSPDLNYLLCT